MLWFHRIDLCHIFSISQSLTIVIPILTMRETQNHHNQGAAWYHDIYLSYVTAWIIRFMLFLIGNEMALCSVCPGHGNPVPQPDFRWVPCLVVWSDYARNHSDRHVSYVSYVHTQTYSSCVISTYTEKQLNPHLAVTMIADLFFPYFTTASASLHLLLLPLLHLHHPSCSPSVFSLFLSSLEPPSRVRFPLITTLLTSTTPQPLLRV